VVGESGTGKELAARAIHFSGRRKAAPFVTVDCGAVPDSLVESELFGHRRGAFTGAEADRKGLFEEADGGTLFLDEVTNTSTVFQAKLLRVLQTGEFRRVGEAVPRKVDVRIIAATNADLDEAIREGRFREDLYYRLNVVPVRMPPLRERREDIPALAEHAAKAFCEKEKVVYRGIGEAALKRLREHGWPGNVRELKNAVEAALILSRDGAVRREFLPEAVRGGSFEEIRDLLRGGAASLGDAGADEGPQGADPQAPAESNAEAPGPDPARGSAAASGRPGAWLTEDQLNAARDADDHARIFEALRRAEGDKSLAAVSLGWSRMTLYRKMQRLGIDYATGKPTETQPA
jgi:DNA-binding NtrC family response regulator